MLPMFLSSVQVRGYPYHDYTYSIRDAFGCIAQANTTLLDCTVLLCRNISTILAIY